MKSVFRYVLMMLAFTMEVRVKAAQVDYSFLVQEPQNCIHDEFLCAIFNKSNRFRVPLGSQKLILGKNTGVVRESEEYIQFLKGVAYIETDSKLNVKTEFGDIFLSQGKILVKKSKNQIQFVCIEGQVQYQPKGEKHLLLLPPAYEVYMAAVNEKGKAQTGFAHAALVKNWIPLWSSVFQGSGEKFKQEVQAFKEGWQVAVDQAPKWYRDVVDRRLAEAKDKRQRQAAYRKRKREENKYFRDLFRKKNYVF